MLVKFLSVSVWLRKTCKYLWWLIGQVSLSKGSATVQSGEDSRDVLQTVAQRAVFASTNISEEKSKYERTLPRSNNLIVIWSGRTPITRLRSAMCAEPNLTFIPSSTLLPYTSCLPPLSFFTQLSPLLFDLLCFHPNLLLSSLLPSPSYLPYILLFLLPPLLLLASYLLFFFSSDHAVFFFRPVCRLPYIPSSPFSSLSPSDLTSVSE